MHTYDAAMRSQPRTSRVWVLGIVVTVMVSAACATDTEVATTTSLGTVTTAVALPTTPTEPVVSRHAGEPWFLGTIPSTATPADAALEPVRLGMINQENTPLGSYPELRAAAVAAARWVNAELGGVDGHPIEIHTCQTAFSAEQSESCARRLIEEGVVAFVGGVDVMSGASYPVIEENGLVSVGGIPASLAEQRSSNAFFFSGGDAGALAAFMSHAADAGSGIVALAYGDGVESFEVFARDYGAEVGDSLGLEVLLIPFPLFTTDFEPILTQARDGGAEAVMVLATTTACVPVMQAMADLQYEAQLYLTGACASESTIREAGDLVLGVLFNAEGPVDGADLEASIFQDVIDGYAVEPAGGAGTVAFRGFMNLYALLQDVGFEGAESAVIADAARSAAARPSFWGHPYTCDGNQVPGLPALCAPQQLLFEVGTDGALRSVTGWIATDDLFADALG
jgi:branched-chain amino acid transport system substrate-binding protein